MRHNWLFSILFVLTVLVGAKVSAKNKISAIPLTEVEAKSRILRIDILWDRSIDGKSWLWPIVFEVEKSSSPTGPFRKAHEGYLKLPAYSDFIGKPEKKYYYRVRSMTANDSVRLDKGKDVETSPWSEVVSGTSTKYKKEQFLTEVQEAGFRYFYNYAHPVSGMALEGAPHRNKKVVATGATSMGLFNLVVGIRRSFITKEQGTTRVLKILTFLTDKAERFHGAFPHWLDGTTGATVRFSPDDDGADLVETAFLAQSFVMMRESFTGSSRDEKKIRELADKLWRDIEWDFFVKKKGGRTGLIWHWSPNVGFKMNHLISGFSECHIAYIMALVSPTHPITVDVYKSGWISGHYSKPRKEFGVDVEIGHRGAGAPMFFLHYSYMGMDPRTISHNGKTYFEHFRAITKVQQLYALSKADTYKGYDKMWGLTSSMGPDGYLGHSPSRHDNGTIAPTAALSSMPYLPKEVYQCMIEMYRNGETLWGPFGFYDSFNQNRDWVANAYLGIDVGPIGPMIENSRTGLFWKRFMQAPELKKLKKLGSIH